ncbi:MFS transporter [Pseudonocardia nematodicida]|uniref:MFS transporter n=1 Tax=Pseudonocardia nematodicida TaxID=1206997 RepID=A0ABV1K5J3_9PSEU
MSTSARDTSPTTRQSTRRASVAGLLGTAIEGYDFAVYAYLVVFIAPLFFPAENRAIGILAALLALGAGFLARPLGGIYFGRMGDRYGRRFTLVVTITIMGTATFLMGLLPTYDSIGIMAPILLVLLRFVQGFSVGGELMGAATFVTEHSSQKNYGFLSAIVPFGNALGGALAPGVVGIVTLFVADDLMGAWGWRIPLLLSLPLTVLVVVLRRRLHESPEFGNLARRRDTTAATPVAEVLKHHRRALLQVIGLATAVMFIGLFALSYIPLDMQFAGGRSAGEAARYASIAMFCAMPCQLLMGRTVDRFGRYRVQLVMFCASAAAVFPLLYVIGNADRLGVLAPITYVLFVCIAATVSIPAFGAFTALFPTHVRYTGAAIGFGIGSVMGSGFGPFLSSLSAEVSGTRYAPGFLFVGIAVIGLLTTWSTRPRSHTATARTDGDAPTLVDN